MRNASTPQLLISMKARQSHKAVGGACPTCQEALRPCRMTQSAQTVRAEWSIKICSISWVEVADADRAIVRIGAVDAVMSDGDDSRQYIEICRTGGGSAGLHRHAQPRVPVLRRDGGPEMRGCMVSSLSRDPLVVEPDALGRLLQRIINEVGTLAGVVVGLADLSAGLVSPVPASIGIAADWTRAQGHRLSGLAAQAYGHADALRSVVPRREAVDVSAPPCLEPGRPSSLIGTVFRSTPSGLPAAAVLSAAAGAVDVHFGLAEALNGSFEPFGAGCDLRRAADRVDSTAATLRRLVGDLHWYGVGTQPTQVAVTELADRMTVWAATLDEVGIAWRVYGEQQHHDRALLRDLLSSGHEPDVAVDAAELLARMTTAERRLIELLLRTWPAPATAVRPSATATRSALTDQRAASSVSRRGGRDHSVGPAERAEPESATAP